MRLLNILDDGAHLCGLSGVEDVRCLCSQIRTDAKWKAADPKAISVILLAILSRDENMELGGLGFFVNGGQQPFDYILQPRDRLEVIFRSSSHSQNALRCGVAKIKEMLYGSN